MSNDAAQANDDNTESPSIGVLPPPDQVSILQHELANLKQVNLLMEDQLQAHQAQVKVLETHKQEILDRLRSHEENSFSAVMAFMFRDKNGAAGDFALEAHDAIVELSEFVMKRQEKGTLTIKITVEPYNNALQYSADPVKITEPKINVNKSIFFLQDGKITRENQKQGQLI